jgi:hypothetical protein
VAAVPKQDAARSLGACARPVQGALRQCTVTGQICLPSGYGRRANGAVPEPAGWVL